MLDVSGFVLSLCKTWLSLATEEWFLQCKRMLLYRIRFLFAFIHLILNLYDICISFFHDKIILVLIVWVCCLNMNYVLISIMFVVCRNDVYFLLSMMSDIYFRLGRW